LEITGVGIAIAELKLGRRHEPIRADRESRSGNHCIKDEWFNLSIDDAKHEIEYALIRYGD
jgi:hypothetical protein